MTPFADLQLVKLSFSNKDKDPQFGLRFIHDPLLSKPYIENISPGTPALSITSSQKASSKKFRGAYLIEIDSNHTSNSKAATEAASEQKLNLIKTTEFTW